MKIKEVMTKNIKSVTPQSGIDEAAKIMENDDTGFVPVVTDGILCGVITDRDIALRCVAQNTNPQKLAAKDIMSTRVVHISPDNSVTEAARLMAKEQIRRLPVCEEGKLVGVITLGDISRSKNYFSETAAAFCDISKPE